MANKFPYEYLDPNDSFDENDYIHRDGHIEKFKIITEWKMSMVTKYNS